MIVLNEGLLLEKNNYNMGIYKNNTYYRYTYNGIGIYEALKQNVDFEVWRDILHDDNISWLPKPPDYLYGFNSYFTEFGNTIFKEKTLPLCKKYLKSSLIKMEKVTNIEDFRIIYKDLYQIVIFISIDKSDINIKYSTPYSYNEIKKNYGNELAIQLYNDPAHRFRMMSGIELIHKEPSIEELNRIYKNWNYMSTNMKRISDLKCLYLFNKKNKEYYNELKKIY